MCIEPQRVWFENGATILLHAFATVATSQKGQWGAGLRFTVYGCRSLNTFLFVEDGIPIVYTLTLTLTLALSLTLTLTPTLT